MTILGGAVLFMMIWFVALFVCLPIGLRTQGEEGEVVRGTHSSSPHRLDMRRKLIIATLIAVVLWAIVAGIILSGWIGLSDIDFFNRLHPSQAGGRGA